VDAKPGIGQPAPAIETVELDGGEQSSIGAAIDDAVGQAKLISGTVRNAQGNPAASALVLHFPDDLSLGVVHIRPAGLHAYDSFENVYLGWELLGAARGELHVPRGMESRLTVANGAVEAITPLTQISDGIDRLGFWKTQAKDEALQAIIHLKGLKDLSARGTQITDAGLRNIRDLKVFGATGPHGNVRHGRRHCRFGSSARLEIDRAVTHSSDRPSARDLIEDLFTRGRGSVGVRRQ